MLLLAVLSLLGDCLVFHRHLGTVEPDAAWMDHEVYTSDLFHVAQHS